VTSFCYNGPRVPLGYAPVLQNILLFCVVFCSKGRVSNLISGGFQLSKFS